MRMAIRINAILTRVEVLLYRELLNAGPRVRWSRKCFVTGETTAAQTV